MCSLKNFRNDSYYEYICTSVCTSPRVMLGCIWSVGWLMCIEAIYNSTQPASNGINCFPYFESSLWSIKTNYLINSTWSVHELFLLKCFLVLRSLTLYPPQDISLCCIQHIETQSEWTPFRKRHFHIHFPEWNVSISLTFVPLTFQLAIVQHWCR